MNDRKNDGYICPVCGEWDVRTEDYEMDVDCLWVKLYCPHCEADWCEYYTPIYDGYNHNGKIYDVDGKECTDI